MSTLDDGPNKSGDGDDEGEDPALATDVQAHAEAMHIRSYLEAMRAPAILQSQLDTINREIESGEQDFRSKEDVLAKARTKFDEKRDNAAREQVGQAEAALQRALDRLNTSRRKVPKLEEQLRQALDIAQQEPLTVVFEGAICTMTINGQSGDLQIQNGNSRFVADASRDARLTAGAVRLIDECKRRKELAGKTGLRQERIPYADEAEPGEYHAKLEAERAAIRRAAAEARRFAMMGPKRK